MAAAVAKKSRAKPITVFYHRAVTVRRTILLLLIVAGVLFRAWILTSLPRDLGVCSSDFASFYAGGKLAGSLAFYSPDAVFAAEKAAMGCYKPYLIFIRPPFYALLMAPFAHLPFEAAYWLWRMLGLAALGVFLWLWPGDKLAAVAGCAWFFPLAANFTVGQDVTLVLALATGAWWCWKHERPVWAGILLGLCVIKFHLFLLLPVLLWHRRMWRTALAGAAVVLALIGINYAVYGAAWLPRYVAALGDSRLNPYAENMVNLSGLFQYHHVWIAAAVLVAAVCWYAIVHSSLEIAVAVMLAGGVLITPHTSICDGVMFLPLLLLACTQRVTRPLAIFALTPLYRFLPPGLMQVIMVGLIGWIAWSAGTHKLYIGWGKR
jgi:hypothetical protein